MNINEVIQSSDIWKDVLKLLHGESYGVITEENISKLAPELAAKAKIQIDEINEGNSWNLSIQRLQALVDSAYTEDGQLYQEMLEAGARGDAGANYYGVNSGEDWVEPNINADNNTYSEVRAEDKIIPVLNRSNESQFTIDKIAGNICRLIMPKYMRRVEVEDLNRNFWVIAQVIAALSDDIFDDESPRYEIMRRILDEITQLWENVAYLWAATGLLSKEEKVVTQWMQIPISPSTGDLLLGYKNYDDFDINWVDSDKDNFDGLGVLAHLFGNNHMKYYFDSFPESNCIYIPFVRSNNYKENFFCKLVMPGLMFHNCKTKTNFVYDFVSLTNEQIAALTEGNFSDINSFGGLLYVDMIDLSIKKKVRESSEVTHSKILDFSSSFVTSAPGRDGINYNELKVVPQINIEELQTVKELNNTELFYIENNANRIIVSGTTYSIPSQELRVINGYRTGFINLTFRETRLTHSPSYRTSYLGDVVSYYA